MSTYFADADADDSGPILPSFGFDTGSIARSQDASSDNPSSDVAPPAFVNYILVLLYRLYSSLPNLYFWLSDYIRFIA